MQSDLSHIHRHLLNIKSHVSAMTMTSPHQQPRHHGDHHHQQQHAQANDSESSETAQAVLLQTVVTVRQTPDSSTL